jgi:hypothetical protein
VISFAQSIAASAAASNGLGKPFSSLGQSQIDGVLKVTKTKTAFCSYPCLPSALGTVCRNCIASHVPWNHKNLDPILYERIKPGCPSCAVLIHSWWSYLSVDGHWYHYDSLPMRTASNVELHQWISLCGSGLLSSPVDSFSITDSCRTHGGPLSRPEIFSLM